MKTKSIFYSAIAFLLLLITSVSLSAQVAEVGVIRNGQGVITNANAANQVLKAGLSSSATVTNSFIEKDPASGIYYLIGQINNDKVTGKAVELQPGSGGELRAISGGPGLEVSCYGFKCSSCYPLITNFKPRCTCGDPIPSSETRCDMSTKVVLSIW